MNAIASQLYACLRVPEGLLGLNGPAFDLLVEEVECLGKSIPALTLRDLERLDLRVRQRYAAEIDPGPQTTH